MNTIRRLLFGAVLSTLALQESAAQASCFYAIVQRDTVRIYWCPPGETNHYGAYLQRRQSGQSEFAERPCFFPAYCARGPLLTCLCYDVVPGPGVWFYRMKLVDLDGTITYSTTIEVQVTLTAVTEEKPLTFALHHNYPNPFNPTTRIEYAIPKTSHVSLKVFDVCGREVARLVDEVQGSGYKTVEFIASELASGVYFYRLRAGSFLELKKMIVTK